MFPFVLVSFMVTKICLVLLIKYVPRGMCWVTENKVGILGLSELGLVGFQVITKRREGWYLSFL